MLLLRTLFSFGIFLRLDSLSVSRCCNFKSSKRVLQSLGRINVAKAFRIKIEIFEQISFTLDFGTIKKRLKSNKKND